MDADFESDKETKDLCDGMAAIFLSKETKRRIRAPWAKALIVKVFGKTVGLTSCMLSLWDFGNQQGELTWWILEETSFL